MIIEDDQIYLPLPDKFYIDNHIIIRGQTKDVSVWLHPADQPINKSGPEFVLFFGESITIKTNPIVEDDKVILKWIIESDE